MKRIESIDIVRGIAVLQMIFWQIYDFFARTDIYAASDPLFFQPFNSPINGIGLILFAFISGTSLLFTVRKREHLGRLKVIYHSILRYGSYIIVSLFFTSFVFGFRIFYIWGEAIQGIGLAAMAATVLILLIRSKWIIFFIGILLSVLQPFIRAIISNPYIMSNWPLEPTTLNAQINLVSLLLNMSVRGYFSLLHILPVMLFGVFLSYLIIKYQKKIIPPASFIMIGFAALGLIFHILWNSIDVYNWTPAYQFFYASVSILLFILAELTLRSIGRINLTYFLSVFGQTPIIAYLGHFLLVKKPLEIFGLENTFSSGISLIFAILIVSIFYYISKMYIKRGKKARAIS